jgi:hypothetical protein
VNYHFQSPEQLLWLAAIRAYGQHVHDQHDLVAGSASGADAVEAWVTGTVNWINAMSSCITGPTGCLSSKVQQITGNIFALFGKGPAGLSTPSVPNWSSIQPVGS